MPPRSAVAPQEATSRAMRITCSGLSTEQGPAITALAPAPRRNGPTSTTVGALRAVACGSDLTTGSVPCFGGAIFPACAAGCPSEITCPSRTGASACSRAESRPRRQREAHRHAGDGHRDQLQAFDHEGGKGFQRLGDRPDHRVLHRQDGFIDVAVAQRLQQLLEAGESPGNAAVGGRGHLPISAWLALISDRQVDVLRLRSSFPIADFPQHDWPPKPLLLSNSRGGARVLEGKTGWASHRMLCWTRWRPKTSCSCTSPGTRISPRTRSPPSSASTSPPCAPRTRRSRPREC